MIHHSTCSLCEAMCGLDIEVEDGEIRSIRGDEADPFSRGFMCPKGVALKDLYEDPDRITTPMRREGDRWEEISWEAALDETADRMHRIRDANGADAIGLYVGNPTAHNSELVGTAAALVAELRTRNRFSATSTDQLPHMFAALHMYGHQLLFNIPDIDRIDHLVILGANPVVSNGSVMAAPNIRKRLKAIQERGGRVVVIDPRRTETAELADAHHAIRPGTDALLIAAMITTLFEEKLVQRGAWERYTEGTEALREALRRFTPERVAPVVGIAASEIRRITRELATISAAALYGRVGPCTQAFGGLAAWLLNSFNVLTDHLDRPGTMMFTSPALDLVGTLAKIGQRGSSHSYRSRVSGLPEFSGELPAAALAEEIETPGPRQLRALITACGNPVLSAPNGPRIDRALGRLDFMVSLDIYRNETTRHANILLPGVSPLERGHFSLLSVASVRNMAKHSKAVMPLRGDGRPEWRTVLALTRELQERRGVAGRAAALATRSLEALGPDRLVDLGLRNGPYGRFGALRERKARPMSLAALEAHPHGIDLGALLGHQLPARLHTADKRLHLAPEIMLSDLPRLAAFLEERAGRDPEVLDLIGRRHLRSNNSWMHNSERLVKGKARCTLLMHPTDAGTRGIRDGDTARLSSRVGSVEATVSLDAGIMPGVVSLPHGWGHHRPGTRLSVAEGVAGVSANDVTDDAHVDQLTGTAGFNGVPVTVSAVP